jgi:signal transduction histidine kinase
LQPEEHLTYERLSEIIHPDDRETVRNTLRNAIAINGDHSSEYRVVGPGGQVRWISSLGRCFHNGEHRMIGVTLDITDRKHSADLLEQTVIERTAKLKEALSELESFSYSISHDMRAPLRSMQGFAAILMEDCGDELSPEARACLDRIAASAERMDRLIQDVLTFSRVTRSDFLMESVDLDRLIRGVIESFPNLQPPKAAIAIEGKLPLVLGNAAGLTQCLSNILGNAVKFVAHGTSPQVRVWTESAGPDRSQFVRVYIKDNGIGIPHESHEKIFEIFQRLSKRYDGTGIGLAIVKKAVERMGGKVGLTSSPDNGSTFWLELKVPA